MTDADFDDWAVLHCEATAAAPAVKAALVANRRIFLGDWRATLAELGECTHRLVVGMRVPKFAPDAVEAVAVELMALRRERAEQAKPLHDHTQPVACSLCRDTGLVVVPHWRCVEVPHDGPPRLVAYRDTNVEYRSVIEVSVRCDRPDCRAGYRQADMEAKRDADKRRMRLSTFLTRIGGNLSAASVVELLAQHNRAIATNARLRSRTRDSGWDALIARILKRMRGEDVQDQGKEAA